MNRSRRLAPPLWSWALPLLAATALPGAPPSIASISPRGAQQGRTVVITVEGANLSTDAELLVALPGPRTLLTADPHKPAANRVSFEIALSRSDAPGPYPLRVRTAEGISNPVLFLVGVLPEAAEVEPNDLFEAAQPITLPATVNGSLGATDRDTFRFAAKAGQRLTFEVEARRIGSAIDPTLHLMARNGREIALSEDARGLGVDARIDFTIPADGEYLVQVHDAMYLGQAQSFYRLKAGSLAWAEGVFPLGGRRGSEVLVAFEGGTVGGDVVQRVRFDAPPAVDRLAVALPPGLDSGGSLPFPMGVGELPEVLEAAREKPEAAQPAPIPSTINGRLERPGEADRYEINVKAGQRWVLEVAASGLGSHLDAVVHVSKPDGGRIATADDEGSNPDPRLEVNVPDGVEKLVVSIEDLHRRGGHGFGYRLTVRENRPEFILTLGTASVSVPRKGTEHIPVDVVRRGYGGPIRLELVAPPPGFELRGGLVPAGQARGVISITAPPEARLRALELQVRGMGEGDVEPAVARGTVFLAADRGQPVSPLRVGEVAAAVAQPLPVAVRVEGPVRLVPGHTVPLKVLAQREGGAAGALKLQAVHLPPGITAAEGAIADAAADGSLKITSAPNAALGVGEGALRASGKVGGQDLSAATPVFTVQVVAPFVLELTRAALEGPVGAMIELEGKVRREAPFAGEVDLKVEGIPGGGAGPQAKVAATADSFKLSIPSGEPLKPGKIELKLSAATKLGDPKSPTVFSAPPVPFTVTLTPPVPAAGAAGAKAAAGGEEKTRP